jgi:hypothetical protein
MTTEVNQIKRFLAEKHGLKIEGTGENIKLVGTIPDGEHVIPLGASLKPRKVVIKDDRIHLGEVVEQ